ncbi:hypothetical protein ACHAXT_004742 [Thalassiosira profunda]
MIDGAMRSGSLLLRAGPAGKKLAATGEATARRKVLSSACLLWAVLATVIGLNACTVAWLPLMHKRSEMTDGDPNYALPGRKLVRHERIKQQAGAPSLATNADSHRREVPASPQQSVESDASALPIYTKEQAYLATRPVPWTCGDEKEAAIDPLTGHKSVLAFVHVYKAAGSTIRNFFMRYAHTCKRSWMVLIGCTGVDPTSVEARDTNWKKCRVKEIRDRERNHDHENKDERLYPTVNATILKENVDIVGGHFRIGTGDSVFGHVGDRPTTNPIRHIVFLRDPMARLVSGVLYQHQNNEEEHSLDATVAMIKKRIRGSHVKNKEYSSSSLKYLLTPHQAEKFANMDADQIQPADSRLSPEERLAEAKARMAIQNLVDYNAIIGMSESMDHSMRILRHVLTWEFSSDQREERVQDIFDEYILDDEKNDEEGVRKNVSERDDGVSTGSVLAELKKDAEFMTTFKEYVKYEQMITDYAWRMHSMQYEMTRTSAKSE